MCGIGEALNNLFPTGWLDPYGSMPLNKEYSVQIDITQVETDDGIKVTAVKTPPHASTTSVQDAINMALGMGCCDDEENVENCQPEKKPEKPETEPEDKPENDDIGKSDDKPDWTKKKDD